MDLCLKFLLRFDLKNKVLKPNNALFNLSREPIAPKNNLITLFIKLNDLKCSSIKIG
jgi:hypothetical protein